MSRAVTPRCYYVLTPTGTFRRNRRKLRPIDGYPDINPDDDEDMTPTIEREEAAQPEVIANPPQPAAEPPAQQQPAAVQTRSGRNVRPPGWHKDYGTSA